MTNHEHAVRLYWISECTPVQCKIDGFVKYLNEHFPEQPDVEVNPMSINGTIHIPGVSSFYQEPDHPQDNKLSEIHSDLLRVRQMVEQIRDGMGNYSYRVPDNPKLGPRPGDIDPFNKDVK